MFTATMGSWGGYWRVRAAIALLTLVLLPFVSHAIVPAASAAPTVKYHSTLTGFANPTSVATDTSGHVYVLDNFGAISKFGPDGTLVGGRNLYFSTLFGIAVSPTGDIYVAESPVDVIEQFAPDFMSVRYWGANGNGPGEFRLPTGLAVDAVGDVYVADSDNHRIQVFNSSGAFVRTWGGLGTSHGQFDGPWGVAIDRSRYVYVADKNNGRVEKFTPTGDYVGSIGSPNLLVQNFGVDVSPGGNIFVADTYGQRVQEFDPDGAFMGTIAGPESGDLQISQSLDVATDSANLYIADYDHQRVERWVDAVPPVLTVPSEVVAETTELEGTTVNYTVTTRDNFDAEPIVKCSPASGKTFHLGVTEVSCIAVDAAGNRTPLSTFHVIVSEVRPVGRAETLAPIISAARISPTAFAVASGRAATPFVARRKRVSRGTTIYYRLSEDATVTFTTRRLLAGRKAGRECQKPTSRNRRNRLCTRHRLVGKFEAPSTFGANSKAFSGKIGRRALRSGRYRITLAATDAAGNRSRPKRLNFRVLEG